MSCCGSRFGEQDGHADEGDSPVGLCCLIGWHGHAWLIMLRLYVVDSTAGAWPGTARITVLYKAPQFLLSSLALLHTDTSGELGHQVMHTRLTTPDTQPSVPLGQCSATKRRLSNVSSSMPVTRTYPIKWITNDSSTTHSLQTITCYC